MRLIHVVALAALAVVVPVGNPGCSKYGEGSICDPDNTDPETGISDDCEDGLLCTQGLCADARGICCPPPGHNITAPACEGMCGNGTGGSNSGGGSGTSVGGFTASGGGGGGTGGMAPMCPHDECVIGAPLIAGYQMMMGDPPCGPKGQCPTGKVCVDSVCRTPICSECVNDICNGRTNDQGKVVIPADPTCCGTHAWDMFCVEKVATECKHQCSMNTGGGGSGGSGGMSTPNGGGGMGGAGGTP